MIRFLSKLHEGIIVARNLGLEKSEGSKVAFLDSDDHGLPSKLSKQDGVCKKILVY